MIIFRSRNIRFVALEKGSVLQIAEFFNGGMYCGEYASIAEFKREHKADKVKGLYPVRLKFERI
jgi:hypothetical protein